MPRSLTEWQNARAQGVLWTPMHAAHQGLKYWIDFGRQDTRVVGGSYADLYSLDARYPVGTSLVKINVYGPHTRDGAATQAGHQFRVEPINGQDVISFTDLEQSIKSPLIPFSSCPGLMVCSVLEMRTGSGNRGMTYANTGTNEDWGGNAVILMLGDAAAASITCYYSNGARATTTGVPLNKPFMFTTILQPTGTRVQQFLNGKAGSTSGGDATWTNLNWMTGGNFVHSAYGAIGWGANESAARWLGRHAEHVVFEAAPEVLMSLRPKVEGYLAHRWATSPDLDGDHLHKSRPPLIMG